MSEVEAATPRRPWWRRWYTLTGAAMAGLLVIGGAFGDDQAGEPVSAELATATPQVAPTTVAPTATTAPTTTAPTTTTAAPTTLAPTTTVAPATTVPPTTAAPTTTTAPPTTAPPTTMAAPAAQALTVTAVIDGDTVDVSSGDRVRIIGIDAPERGECGFDQAATHLASLVAGRTVTLAPGARDDVDRYGRILRYVDTSDGTDVGLALIQADLAISRYDSRDGYGRHAREAAYVAADDGQIAGCTTAPGQLAGPPAAAPLAGAGDVHFQNCDAARAAGSAPLYAGQPGYRDGLDGDRDGVACE